MASSVRSITDVAMKVKTPVDDIDRGSQEEARGIEQVAKVIVQIQGVTQTNASSAEESAAAGEQLSAQSQTLRGIVRDLSALVGGQHVEGHLFGKHPAFGALPS